MPEIGRELGVDAVVEGSVQRVGGRIRITAQLIRASTDKHVWASDYERDAADVLKLEAEVARTIAQEIQARLTPEDLDAAVDAMAWVKFSEWDWAGAQQDPACHCVESGQ